MDSFPDPWVFVVMVLATVRLVHFILWDSLAGLSTDSNTRISRRLDAWAFDADGHDRAWLRGKIGTGLTCMHCVGGWIALAVVCVVAWSPPWQLGVEGAVTWLAVWGAQAFVSYADWRFVVD